MISNPPSAAVASLTTRTQSDSIPISCSYFSLTQVHHSPFSYSPSLQFVSTVNLEVGERKGTTHTLDQNYLHLILLLNTLLDTLRPVLTGIIIDCNIATLSCEFQTNKLSQSTMLGPLSAQSNLTKVRQLLTDLNIPLDLPHPKIKV
jgi:hypothetical protein